MLLAFALTAGLAPPPTVSRVPCSTSLLEDVVDAARAALSAEDVDGRDRDGSWCLDARRLQLEDALGGLRGRKLAWWLDAPRPLRATAVHDLRLDVSVVALPGGAELPAGAPYPAGAIILVKPLLGTFECRRVRRDGGGATMELMRKQLRASDACFTLGGGAWHEWRSLPGVASAFVRR